MTFVSVTKLYGGMARLSGAGLFLNTRPARSNVEPWHGHSQPPGQSSGRLGCAPGVKRAVGEQPRWVQTPTATKYSGLMRAILVARVDHRREFRRVAQRLRIGELVVVLRQRSDHRRVATDDPHRLAAPLERAQLADLHAGDVGLDRRAGRLRALGRLHAAHERRQRRDAGHAARGAARDQQVAARVVDPLRHGRGAGLAVADANLRWRGRPPTTGRRRTGFRESLRADLRWTWRRRSPAGFGLFGWVRTGDGDDRRTRPPGFARMRSPDRSRAGRAHFGQRAILPESSGRIKARPGEAVSRSAAQQRRQASRPAADALECPDPVDRSAHEHAEGLP